MAKEDAYASQVALTEMRLQRAQKFESQGKPLHAIQIYLSVINSEHSIPQAYFSLINIYEQMKKQDLIPRLLDAIVEDFCDDINALIFVGHYHFKSARWERVIGILDGKEDKDGLAFFFVGYSFYMIHEYEKADENFVTFIDKVPDSTFVFDVQLIRAKIAIDRKKFDDAIELLELCKQVKNDNYEVFQLSAFCFFEQGMFANAAVEIDRALALNKSDADLVVTASKIYLQTEELHKAEDLLFPFVSRGTANSEIYGLLGITVTKMGRYTEGENYLRIAIKMDPENILLKEALNSLSLFYTK